MYLAEIHCLAADPKGLYFVCCFLEVVKMMKILISVVEDWGKIFGPVVMPQFNCFSAQKFKNF